MDTAQPATSVQHEKLEAKARPRVRKSGANSSGEKNHSLVEPGQDVRDTRDVVEWFRAGDVVQIVQISRRQLQYWAQTDLVGPSTKTPGGHGRYLFEDLVALKAAKRLIDAGVSVQRIRQSIRALRRILPTVKKPLSELVLVATGDVVLAFKDGTAFDAISGQEWVFEVAQFQREIDAWRQGRPPLSMTVPQPGNRAPSDTPPTA